MKHEPNLRLSSTFYLVFIQGEGIHKEVFFREDVAEEEAEELAKKKWADTCVLESKAVFRIDDAPVSRFLLSKGR